MQVVVHQCDIMYGISITLGHLSYIVLQERYILKRMQFFDARIWKQLLKNVRTKMNAIKNQLRTSINTEKC